VQVLDEKLMGASWRRYSMYEHKKLMVELDVEGDEEQVRTFRYLGLCGRNHG
jgi:hypothetical protein